MKNDFIMDLLARLFDKFKAKNPKIAAIIILVLIMLLAGLQNGLAEAVGLPNLGATAVQWVSIVLLALQGSRTTAVLYGDNKNRPEGS